LSIKELFYFMTRYPPLRALVAFDAAMRTNSFSLAAEELSVTPGAVGQQIQKLEQWMGTSLFVRQVRKVQPTAEALAYWKQIQPALAQVLAASRRLRDNQSRVVSLSMPPSFAAKWFPHRMAGLLIRYPTIELHLNATSALVDFEREPIDLAIRHFGGDDPALDAVLLYRDDARVYCSPGYAAGIGLRRPTDLSRATLLDTSAHPYWPAWLNRFARLTAAQTAAIGRIHFDQSLMAIEAARLGQGVVLTSALLTEEEMAVGTLVEPFAHRLPLASGYYVVHHRKWPLGPAAEAVREWLVEETRRYRGAT
jgi:LysR family glycine cleavage system transcriptional activator